MKKFTIFVLLTFLSYNFVSSHPVQSLATLNQIQATAISLNKALANFKEISIAMSDIFKVLAGGGCPQHDSKPQLIVPTKQVHFSEKRDYEIKDYETEDYEMEDYETEEYDLEGNGLERLFRNSTDHEERDYEEEESEKVVKNDVY